MKKKYFTFVILKYNITGYFIVLLEIGLSFAADAFASHSHIVSHIW